MKTRFAAISKAHGVPAAEQKYSIAPAMQIAAMPPKTPFLPLNSAIDTVFHAPVA